MKINKGNLGKFLGLFKKLAKIEELSTADVIHEDVLDGVEVEYAQKIGIIQPRVLLQENKESEMLCYRCIDCSSGDELPCFQLVVKKADEGGMEDLRCLDDGRVIDTWEEVSLTDMVKELEKWKNRS